MKTRARATIAFLAKAAGALAVLQLVLAGSAGPAELVLSAAAGVAAAAYAVQVASRARAPFRPPRRWARALGPLLPQLAVESALLGRALVRQLAGGPRVAGADDEGPPPGPGADAATAAVAAALYPCLTPNTVVRAVQHGRVSGRRLLDRDGHRLADDLRRLR